MRKKRMIGIIAVMCTGSAILAGIWLARKPETSNPAYLIAPVERGDIVTTITSTGTIEPVSTVNVGTQVSGIIDKIYVDFNDTVAKGQVIAELDRTVLSGMLDEAFAARDRAKAQFDLAQAEFLRNEPIYKKGFIAEQELVKLRADFLTQQAMLQSAEASVKKARTNLGYATITSPITGTVIQRSIEAGQTVAANFSAPTLFIIAENLRRMEILANVDEADIGAIRKGQAVTYTVQAFADKKFYGTVEQVRLQPVVSQNVVTYTVVISTENSDGTLLPGMTATVDFIIEKATAVLLVPSAALRFRLTGDPEMPMMRHRRGAEGAMNPKRQRGDSARAGDAPHFAMQAGDRSEVKRGVVWISTADSQPRPIQVRTGITDGKMTQVHSRAELSEGMPVITGVKMTPKKKTKSVSLLPQPGGRH